MDKRRILAYSFFIKEEFLIVEDRMDVNSGTHVCPPVMGTYARFPITLVKGNGSEVEDENGKRYLDFLSGISVLSLGHVPKKVADSLHQQIDKLWHVSNLYRIPSQEKLASKLVEMSCMDQVFFCNSGTEAVEAALKLARIASRNLFGKRKDKFIAMHQSFHGRSFGSLSVTGQESYQAPFKPLLPNVEFVDFGNLQQIEQCLTDDVAAVILEPMQAEGGLHLPPQSYLEKVREYCDQKGVLLIFDEIQVGVGRLGTLFAYQKFGVEPDIMTLAKGIAAGFPMGAMLAKRKISEHFVPGTHASTFGGNPLACTAASATLDEIAEDNFLDCIQSKSERLKRGMDAIVESCSQAIETRGCGMLQGILFQCEVGPLLKLCMEKGLLVGSAGAKVLRIAPALNIPDHQLDEGIQLLRECIEESKL